VIFRTFFLFFLGCLYSHKKKKTKKTTTTIMAKKAEQEMPMSRGAKKTLPKPKDKKRRRKGKPSYSSYIYKVLKQVHPDVGISTNSMKVMNGFMESVQARVTAEADRCRAATKSQTLTARDMRTSCRLIFPGELAKHAVSEGTKACCKFQEAGGK
jgi:histone H2B